MVDIADIMVGDQIKIVDAWDDNCIDFGVAPAMDHFLGTIVTVASTRFGNVSPFRDAWGVDDHCVTILEDDGMFVWNRWMIDYIVSSEMDDFDVPNEDFSAVLKWGVEID